MRGLRLAVSVSLVLVLVGAAVRAQIVRPLTDNAVRELSDSVGSVDSSGSLAWRATNIDPAGGGLILDDAQIVEYDLSTGIGTVLTSFDVDVLRARASRDGNWLAFVSRGNLTGQNPDHTEELFTVHRSGSDLVQVSVDTPGDQFLNRIGIASFAISGSGNKVVFTSRADPFGQNALGIEQVFIVDRDGTNLIQATQRTTTKSGLEDLMEDVTLSDDGSRIAFISDWNFNNGNLFGTEVFAVNGDGTGLRMLTAEVAAVASGSHMTSDGQTIVFASGRIRKIDWTGLGEAPVSPDVPGRTARTPRVTSDGQWVFYDLNDDATVAEIFKVRIDGTDAAQLTTGTDFLTTRLIDAAGDGSRLLLDTSGPIAGLTIDERAMVTIDDAGTVPFKLAEESPFTITGGQSDITDDGSRVALVGDWTGPLYVIETDDPVGPLTPIYDGSAQNPQISSDGQTLVFVSSDDPVGGNADGNRELFAVDADGSNLRQLTTSTGGNQFYYPAISDDGNLVIFEDFDGPDSRLFRVGTDGTGRSQITTHADPGSLFMPRTDVTGNWVVFSDNADPLGLNADVSDEIFRIRSDGSGLEQLTDGLAGVEAILPDISAAGDRIVFQWDADPLGTNADGNQEIFLYETANPGVVVQLTDTTDGNNHQPRISRDGAYAYFYSDATIFDPVPDEHLAPYRVRIADGVVERVGGLFDPTERGLLSGRRLRDNEAVTPDADGSRAAFHAEGRRSMANPDGSAEMWLADFEAPATIFVSKETVVSWTAEPSPVTYDVIRGDVTELQLLPDETVDLGNVTCVEEDSTDDQSDLDAALPAAGQVFFYLYRGSQGGSDGPGSYGSASGGQERGTTTGCAD